MPDANPGNRLDSSSSPYLRQHADNPVHWQLWDDAALTQARERDVPILLSIGYSACHWCHVMAHESFEDAATAEVMNQLFVNIKVDREERPDLDRVYQTAHQILTQQTGGWPLTVFLDPHTLLPFFSGTYFPRTPRYGMPAFTELMKRVATVWSERRDELAEQGEKVQDIFDSLNAPGNPDAELPDAGILKQARDQLERVFDSSHGGFGDAPKFPMPSSLERLLRHWAHSRETRGGADSEALDMVLQSLTRMARGGIFDHLGGGFCRYSVDREWLTPHFEKMLYDNGSLLALYADAMAISPDALFDSVVRDTAGWLLREMQHPDGGFFAALDADSEGEEGRFYVWHREQIRRLLEPDEFAVIETLYGIDKPANFEGSWILHRRDAWRAVVERLALPREQADALLASACQKLFDAREQRPRPGRDDKILTAWNGLAIRGLARASAVLDEPAWAEAATSAVDFIQREMVIDGRLHATWMDGQLGPRAYLEDHAFLLDGLLALLAVRWRDADVRFAVQLADDLLEHFLDRSEGGFFQTAHDAESLIYRPKPTLDESTPAGNAVAASALGRLGYLLGRQDYLDAAENVLRWAGPVMGRAPQGHAALCHALEDALTAPELLLIRGAEAAAWARKADDEYRPFRLVYALPENVEPAAGHSEPLLPAYLPTELPAATTAWLCRNMTCSLPMTQLSQLTAELGGEKVVSLRP
ncbi:MAG: thioredoxin domain-containing protein [Gammaproteobacteria bacterium]|nr:MAG: thioredoxin domain-containing protein [Gammaproteobacteria bacterium]